MIGRMQLDAIFNNLSALGGRRLAALGIIGAAVFAAVAFGSYYLSRPDFEPLYAGLTPQDVSRIGAVLQDEGITFDVNPEGTKVSVPVGQTSRARQVLAEKGLPGSPSAGYELYEKVGPIGLTSFMQEVTRTRVLEGEIARTIQGMKGVKAARVHIVLPDQGSFRRARQPASASVVIRTEMPGDGSSAQAIRQLVAAAVPGMNADQVRIMSTDGTVLAGTDDTGMASSSKMVELEKTISKEMQENVRRTLAPYLGIDNFEISVAARLNLDKRQINETNFDPESKVERSVKSVKESGKSQNDNNRSAVTVEQNIPGQETGASGGGANSKSNDRKEELTNFELNTKSTATVSEGYRVEALTVAVMLNRRQLSTSLGNSPTQEAMDARIKEIETIVGSAAGVDLKRGDRVSVVAVDFLENAALEPIAGPGIGEIIAGQFGSILRAVTIIGVAALLIWFGLKPATRMLLEAPAGQAALAGAGANLTALPVPPLQQAEVIQVAPPQPEPDDNFLSALARKTGNVPAQRLEKIIDLDEAQAASILKQWMKA
ncbi:MAG: flagellar basal-body MS-ring/collar protein FliF [Hyphomicrobiaceae bacterium]|nr:flagellar basal-body MS-ring/collar protein FliF [Hyphomicrobiaceae bacterium]